MVETRHRCPGLTKGDQRVLDSILGRLEGGADRPGDHPGLGRQVVQAIHVLHDGAVLVQVEEEVGKPGGVLDVFDASGRFLGTIQLGEPFLSSVMAATRGDTLIAVTEGPEGKRYLVRMTLRR